MNVFINLVITTFAYGACVDNATALVAAVRDGQEDETIEIAAGTDRLESPLEPKADMTIKDAGINQTILTHVPE